MAVTNLPYKPVSSRKTFSSIEVSSDDITLKFIQTNEAINQQGDTTLEVTVQQEIADFRGDLYSKPVKFTLPQWAIEEIASYGSRYLPHLGRPEYRAL
jgi:hypothetical protein